MSQLAISGGNTITERVWRRVAMVRLHLSGIGKRTTASFLDCDVDTVHRWLTRVEAGCDINDGPRSGRRAILDQGLQLRTIAFYCQKSPLPGCTGWSLRDAERYLKTDPALIGRPVSRSSIQRILHAHAMRPHLYRYFLQITDPDFFPKMEHIIGLYLNPPENLFSYDECTCIQALRRLTPDLPVAPNHPACEEFEYERNGIRDLMAFLNPKTGKIYGQCTDNHNTETFCRVFKDHVGTLAPDAIIHYVMDNLSPHFHENFCKTVADLSRVPYTSLKTGRARRAWLQSEHKRIVVHFVPFHASWLNMVEIWFGILRRKCLKHGDFPSVELLVAAIEAFIATWNEHFAHPFTWSYTGADLYGKAVRRFSKLLLIESKQVDAKFLADELLLMANIARAYLALVPKQDWQRLVQLGTDKAAYMRNIIDSETGSRRQPRAVEALRQFHQVVLA